MSLPDGETNDAVSRSWRDTIIARVERQARRTRNQHGVVRDARMMIQVDREYASAVDAAAAARGISRVGYIRRAVAAFAAADLGRDFTDVVGGAPMPQPHSSAGGVPVGMTRGAGDDGLGFGTWHVAPGQVQAGEG